MSLPVPEPELAEIKKALFEGRKIQAIKLYRKAVGTGLAEAKDAIDKLERELRTASPEKFSTQPSAGGCFGVLITLCILLVVTVWRIGRRTL
jgi:hypothetical protein